MEKTLKGLLMEEIIKDEEKYCFDKSYCDDETWIERNGNKPRELVFLRAIRRFENMTADEIMKYFGDKYEYVVKGYLNTKF